MSKHKPSRNAKRRVPAAKKKVPGAPGTVRGSLSCNALRLLCELGRYNQRGASPIVRELGRLVGISSTATAKMINRLVTAGLIVKQGDLRTCRNYRLTCRIEVLNPGRKYRPKTERVYVMPTVLQCAKCGQGFEKTDPPTIYCGPCVMAFKDDIAGRRARMSRGGNLALTAAPVKPADIPLTLVQTGTGKKLCGLCGSDNVEAVYGHNPFGCGGYVECNVCRGVLDFVPDTGK